MRVQCTLLGLLMVWSLLGCGNDGPPAAEIDGRTQASWEQQLESTLPDEQAAAIAALARFESPPLEKIAAFLDKHGRTVKLAAIQALGTVGPPAAVYARKLAPLMEDEAPGTSAANARDFRNAAMLALQKMGKDAFKPFAHMLVSEEPRYRLRAVFTLSAFAADLPDGTNTLLPLLTDDDANVRREAARALGLAGKGDNRASEALLTALHDRDARVVAAAAVALGGIGGRSDREGQALAELLFAHQSEVRAAAVYGLGLMGVEASPYLGRVEDLMTHDGKRDIRVQAARTHFRISGSAEKALPALEEALQGDDPRTCREAARALGEMGAAGGPAAAELEKAAERFGSERALQEVVREALAAVRGEGSAPAPEAAGNEPLGEEGG